MLTTSRATAACRTAGLAQSGNTPAVQPHPPRTLGKPWPALPWTTSFQACPFGSEHANSACWSTPGAWACPRARVCASSDHALQLPYPWSEHKCDMCRRIRAKTDSEAAVEVSSDDDMISISSISETDSDGFHRHISLIKPTDDGDGGGLGEHKPTDYGDGGGLGEHTGEGICGLSPAREVRNNFVL